MRIEGGLLNVVSETGISYLVTTNDFERAMPFRLSDVCCPKK